jgi:hypothetical protein
MNIETKSCTVEFSKEEMRALRMLEALWQKSNEKDIRDKIPEFNNAKDINECVKLCAQLQQL